MINNKLTLKSGLTVSNRLFKSATSEQLADKHGNPKGALLANLYKTWAKGGASLLITGNIMVDRNALGEPSNVVLDTHSDLKPFKQWAAAAKANGSVIFAQLNHPGKQIPKVLRLPSMSPSAIPIKGDLAPYFNPPRAMEEADIQRVITQFGDAALLVKQAGFDGVQIHAAHGYLITQFLSPRHNQRQDKWQDGSLFLSEVYRTIRAKVGDDYPVIIKLNSSDFQKGGSTEDDAIKMMQLMQEQGIDGIEISGGTYESQAMNGEGQAANSYFLNFARKAKQTLNMPILLTGGFQTKEQIEAALDEGIDMIGLARSVILNPNMPQEIMNGSQSTYQNHFKQSRWDYLNVISTLAWWELQMLRIAKGKSPNPNMSIYRSALYAISHIGRKAFAPRRG